MRKTHSNVTIAHITKTTKFSIYNVKLDKTQFYVAYCYECIAKMSQEQRMIPYSLLPIEEYTMIYSKHIILIEHIVLVIW